MAGIPTREISTRLPRVISPDSAEFLRRKRLASPRLSYRRREISLLTVPGTSTVGGVG